MRAVLLREELFSLERKGDGGKEGKEKAYLETIPHDYMGGTVASNTQCQEESGTRKASIPGTRMHVLTIFFSRQLATIAEPPFG